MPTNAKVFGPPTPETSFQPGRPLNQGLSRLAAPEGEQFQSAIGLDSPMQRLPTFRRDLGATPDVPESPETPDEPFNVEVESPQAPQSALNRLAPPKPKE